MKLLKRLLSPLRHVGKLHKRVCHPVGNPAEAQLTHFLSAVFALTAGAASAYVHASAMGLPAVAWIPAGIGAVAVTYLLLFPLLYIFLLKPAYRLISSIWR